MSDKLRVGRLYRVKCTYFPVSFIEHKRDFLYRGAIVMYLGIKNGYRRFLFCDTIVSHWALTEDHIHRLEEIGEEI